MPCTWSFRLHLSAFVAATIAGTFALTAAERPTVVAANTILADITRQVAGSAATVHCLLPAGVDVHAHEPSPMEVAMLTRADLVVANGAGFEPWLAHLLEGAGYRGPLLEAVSGIDLLHRADGTAHDDDHGSLDPHAWQDPANGIRYARNIRDVLVQIAPDQRASIERRTQLYVAQLEVLAAWMRRQFAALPSERRRLVTSHDSFAYLGRACGLEITPVRGLDSRQEPDAHRVAALVDELRARKVRAIFVESFSNPKMLEQIARDTGAVLGGELYSDSLGPAGSGAETYFGLLRENTLRIISTLERP